MNRRIPIPKASRAQARQATLRLEEMILRLQQLADFPPEERTPEASRARRESAQADFAFFNRTYLPELIQGKGCPLHEALDWTLADLADGRPVTPLDPAPFGEVVARTVGEADQSDIQAAVFGAPRGHAKSTRGSIAYPLWCALTGRKVYQQLVSDTRDQACGFTEAIRAILEHSPRLRTDFGQVEVEGGEGVLDIAVPALPDGSRPSHRLARIQGFGTGQKLRGRTFQGRRPDQVVLDDAENDEAVENPARRKKLRQWFTKAVIPALDPTKGSLLALGTILHEDSLLQTLLRMFGGAVWRCWDEEERPLWGERFPAKHLRYLRNVMDSEDPGSFAQEMENRAQGDDEKPFKHFDAYDELPERLSLVTHIDPAGGRRRSDYTAMVTVGFSGNVAYVLDAVIERLKPTATGRKVLAVRESYPRSRFRCEDVAYQEALAEIIDLLAAEDGVFVPVELVRPVGDKVTRITSMAPAVETGRIRFPRVSPPAKGNGDVEPFLVGGIAGIRRLQEQLLQFPKGANDDGPDALQGATSGRFRKRPFGGAALGLRSGVIE